jgi:hypothetical protein
MLAKVQYPGPGGASRQFDAEVPDEAPAEYIFAHPENADAQFRAEFVRVVSSMQRGGDVAIYRAIVHEAHAGSASA